jgi:hypothetical protein
MTNGRPLERAIEAILQRENKTQHHREISSQHEAYCNTSNISIS